jgi:hypothetical protein
MIEVDIWLKTPEENLEARFERPVVDGSANQQELATRPAQKPAASGESTAETFDAEAWEAAEVANGRAVMARVEAVTAPVVEELRGAGYEAYASELAPVITVTMPVSAIRQWARRGDVDTIYRGAILGNEMNIARKVVGAHTVNGYGFTGVDSRVAVVEYGGMVSSANPYLAGITTDNPYNCAVDGHVTGIAGIIRSTHSQFRGIAPGTNLWVGCGKTNNQVKTITNHANTWSADTFSLSWFSGAQHSPSGMDKFYDNIMYNYTDLVVKSAGNRGDGDGWVTPPGLGYNTLTVGSFDDGNTIAVGNDVMASYSSYVDPLSDHNDREKPEVAAPGSNIYSTTTASPWRGNIGSGTSYAAPMVAGITSLMYDRNSGLAGWPEATKAIVMATAIKNKEGDTRLSERDGAGGVWALEADWVARNDSIYGRWGGNTYTCATATDWNIATMYLYAGYKTRVVIVWDQNTGYANYSTKPSADLDLWVYDPGMAVVSVSASWDNTYEIVEFTPATTGTYTIQVDKIRCDLTPDYIGWAWSQP